MENTAGSPGQFFRCSKQWPSNMATVTLSKPVQVKIWKRGSASMAVRPAIAKEVWGGGPCKGDSRHSSKDSKTTNVGVAPDKLFSLWNPKFQR